MTAPAGVAGSVHEFGGGHFLQSISLKPGNYTIVLQWQEPFLSLMQSGATTDLDIYLANNDGSILFGFNRNNMGGDPIEVLPFTVRAATTSNIMIVSAGGTTSVNFKYIVFRGDLVINGYNGSATIVGQANAEKAITVGAVRFSNTPTYGVGM